MKMKPLPAQKNKPKQTQFKPNLRKAKIACRKIWPHPLLLLVRFEVAIMGILQ